MCIRDRASDVSEEVMMIFGFDKRGNEEDKADARQKAAAARAARQARIERESVPALARIDKAANRLAAHPAAVDVLLTSLRAAIADPHLKRIKKIDIHAELYRTTVAQANGGTELLFACGYQPDGKVGEDGALGHLVIKQYDAGLLGRAIAALLEAQESDEYKSAKALLKDEDEDCLLYTSPSPRDKRQSRMPSSA